MTTKLRFSTLVLIFSTLSITYLHANTDDYLFDRTQASRSYPAFDNLTLNIHRLRYDKPHQILSENSRLFPQLTSNGISNTNLRSTYITPINISLSKNNIENIVFIADGQQPPGMAGDTASALTGHPKGFKAKYLGRNHGETKSFRAHANSLYSKLRATKWFPINKTYWFHADDHQYTWGTRTAQKEAIRTAYTKQICSQVGSNTKRIYMAGTSRGGALILEIAKRLKDYPYSYGCPDMDNIYLYIQSFDTVFNAGVARREFGAEGRDIDNPLKNHNKRYQAHTLNIAEQITNKTNLKIWNDVSGERVIELTSVHAFTHNSEECRNNAYCYLDEPENAKWYQQVWGTYKHTQYTKYPTNAILHPALDMLATWLSMEQKNPSLIQSNYGLRGNFEMLIPKDGELCHYWRANDKKGTPWNKSECFGENITSSASLIQSNYGKQGNFELVVREKDRLCHYWRANDKEGMPWSKSSCFGENITSAPSLIQSNYGKQGNFELLVRKGNQLCHYWRANDKEGMPWSKSSCFGTNVSSAPSLIQGNYGRQGNFELVVREGNQLCHYWRANDKRGTPWSKSSCFGTDITSTPSFIQGNYGRQGNFELVVREGNHLSHYWRANDKKRHWYKSREFAKNINSAPSLIQSNYGRQGNFELVVHKDDSISHYWRANDRKGQPWYYSSSFEE